MYGRCETDPFDQATDVCDSCYGEFCSACLVKTKGRKHPVCKECTIIASGVRPGAKPLLRGSKKSAGKRRKALQQAPVESPSFEYFDDASPVAVDSLDAPDQQTDDAGGEQIDDHAELVGAPFPAEPDHELEAVEAPAAAPEQTDEPGVASVRSVTPGLAALAQHQAERSGHPAGSSDDDPASVPAPDWLITPDDGASPFADEPSEPAPAQAPAPAPALAASPEPASSASSAAAAPTSTPPAVGTARERTPIDDRAKPVTDGFDWVTEMPARGTSTPLPSRAGAGASAGGTSEPTEQPAGAVATAEAPPAALPRRRSTLRAPDDTRR